MEEKEKYRLALDWVTGKNPPEIMTGLSPGDKRQLGRIGKQLGRWHVAGDIVGFGLGPKLVKGCPCQQWSLYIYLQRKRRGDQVPDDLKIPKCMDIPGLGSICLDVIEMGQPKPSSLTEVNRPIYPGISVGHARSGKTGTIGAFCRLNGEGRYMLSASHVLAAAGLGDIDDDIIQPGAGHWGQPTINSIASLTDFITFTRAPRYPNQVDAAIAKVHDSVQIDQSLNRIKGFATRENIIEHSTVVNLIGCVSGQRVGRILDLNFVCQMQYPIGGFGNYNYGFSHLIRYDASSHNGDSGGALITEDGLLVGIHMGEYRGYAVASAIWNITYHWNLSLMEDI